MKFSSMTSPTNLMESISISFEDDNECSKCVEMNLAEESPERAQEKGVEAGSIGAVDDVSCKNSPESRNDKENHTSLMPVSPPITNAPSSIFRRSDGAPSGSTTTGSSSNSQSALESPKQRAFANSISYDGLFEVRTSKNGTAHVGQSLNPLYEELRHMVGNSTSLVDESVEQENTNELLPLSSSLLLDKKRSLMARADEILQEARKACSRGDSTISELNNFNHSSGAGSCSEEYHLHKEIKRAQSLDRVPSSKEVLEMATRALRKKEKSDERLNSKNMSPAPSSRHASTVHKESIAVKEQTTDDKQNAGDLTICIGQKAGEISDSIQTKTKQQDNALAMKTRPRFPPRSPKSNRGNKVLKRLGRIADEDSSGPGRADNMEKPHQTEHVTYLEPKMDQDEKMGNEQDSKREPHKDPFSIMKFLWGGDDEDGEYENRNIARINPALLACGPAIGKQVLDELRAGRGNPHGSNSIVTALMRRHTSKAGQPPSYAEVAVRPDPRMQDWVDNLYSRRGEVPDDGNYVFGKSKTVIVHEIIRGNWTHAAAWSPDGNRLAVATENHHLAIIDTRSSVFRVRHDKRITGPVRKDTTHSIRAIAWGSNYIAIGGSGNAVSILSPSEPYAILHTITGVGFVGSLDWKIKSDILAIGSRIDRAMLVRIRFLQDGETGTGRQLQSEIIHTIHRRNWVNGVAFSPGGIFLAIGDASGTLSIYRYAERTDELTLISTFTMEDSILVVSFSPDGKFLYSAGEDFRVTCIDTNHWEIVHRMRRDRWVQCIESSRGGSHVAVGGVTSEISILEVNLGWDTVLSVELKGLIPLACSWHPKDHYLCLCGQSRSILVVETTNARHVTGSCLWSCSGILAVEFSPDGRMAVVGNLDGVVTFYELKGDSFVTAYEMVVMTDKSLCIRWAPNGRFICIGSSDALLIVGRGQASTARPNRPENASGFSIRKVIREIDSIRSVSVDLGSRYIVVSGSQTRVFDAKSDYCCVGSLETQSVDASAWSPDGRWLATIGQSKFLTIYDTHFEHCGEWREVFSIEASQKGKAIAWGPTVIGGLAYLAYGGEDKSITIVEIRTNEGTWERVLTAAREDVIQDLHWNSDGLLAAAVANGTVSILDLSYLQAGLAVNEISYDAQRQALTCFTELRRNRGRNCMKAVRWIPAPVGSDNLLAVGGSDGELEILDLTNRSRCRGYSEQLKDYR